MSYKVKNLKEWPSQWHDHFIQYCDLYFCDKNIDPSPVSSSYIVDREECLYALFYFFSNNKQYAVNISHYDKNFVCEITRVDPSKIISEDDGIVFVTYVGAECVLISGMGGIRELKQMVDFIESSIKGDNSDGGGGEEEDVPSDPSPIETFDLDLIGA